MRKYEVLGVKKSASLQEIKGAYQAAALASHPDKQASLATAELKAQVCTAGRSCCAAAPAVLYYGVLFGVLTCLFRLFAPAFYFDSRALY